MLPARPAAQLHLVQQSGDSNANIFPFRTSRAALYGDVDTASSEERFCEIVSSINPDLIRSQTEDRNSQVKHLDSSLLKTTPVHAVDSVSSFSKTNNASQMFSPADN